MKSKEFEKIATRLIKHCQDTLLTKNEEYARNGDRLWNFNEVARINKRSPLDVLMCMKAKHEQSIRDIVSDIGIGKYPTDEQMMEKWGDDINYSILGLAIIAEMRGKANDTD